MSPVFQAMFESEMKECSAQVVTINDFPGPAVEAFINFLYSQHLSQEQLEISATELWGLADKYQVKVLEQYLVTSCPQFVNLDNVLRLVLGADKYKAAQIKKHCLHFMVVNESALATNASNSIESLPHHILVEYFRAHSKT